MPGEHIAPLYLCISLIVRQCIHAGESEMSEQEVKLDRTGSQLVFEYGSQALLPLADRMKDYWLRYLSTDSNHKTV